MGAEVKTGVDVQLTSVGPYKVKTIVPPALAPTEMALAWLFSAVTLDVVPLRVDVSVMGEPTWALLAVVTMVGEAFKVAGSKQAVWLVDHEAPLPLFTAVWNELRPFLSATN